MARYAVGVGRDKRRLNPTAMGEKSELSTAQGETKTINSDGMRTKNNGMITNNNKMILRGMVIGNPVSRKNASSSSRKGRE